MNVTHEDSSARVEFLTHPLGKLIGRHAAPAVASMLFMAFYQITDGIMVGRSLGPEAMASVQVLYPVVALLSGLAVMIGVGGNARIAVLLGAGKNREAGRVLGLIISLGIGLGVLGSAAAVLLMPQLLSLLGTSGTLGNFAGGYLKGVLPFFTFMVLSFILEQSVRNDGSPNLAGGVMALSALLNIGLDYLFLFVLEFGIEGAAIASGISQTVSALIFITYFIRKQLRKIPGLRIAVPDRSLETFRTVVVNGASELFNSLSMGITTFLFNRIILSYIGALGVAALTVVQYPVMLGVMVIMGIGSGTQPIFSYNHGAGQRQRVRGTLVRTTGISLLVGIIIFVLMKQHASAIAALFLPGHPQAVALSGEAARIVSYSMLFMPLAMVFSLYFTALEQAGKSMIVAFSRGLLFPVAGLLIFPLLWGETGIWLTAVFTEAAAVLVAIACFAIKSLRKAEEAPDAGRKALA